MSDFFDILKDLAKVYSFSLQDLLKDLLNGKSSFDDGKPQTNIKHYQEMLLKLNEKINNLQIELNETKLLKEEFQKKLQEEIKKEKYNKDKYNYKDYYKNYEYDNYHYNQSFNEKIARFYAALEVPYNSDLNTVKKAYRKLMKKYHPDFYHNDSEKRKTATIISQKLTEAYDEIKKFLNKK